MQDNAAGWKNLEDRMQSLAFLASQDYDMNTQLRDRFTKLVPNIPQWSPHTHSSTGRDLKHICQSVVDSRKHGRLNLFFSSTEDSSFLNKYNLRLTDLITDITVAYSLDGYTEMHADVDLGGFLLENPPSVHTTSRGSSKIQGALF